MNKLLLFLALFSFISVSMEHKRPHKQLQRVRSTPEVTIKAHSNEPVPPESSPSSLPLSPLVPAVMRTMVQRSKSFNVSSAQLKRSLKTDDSDAPAEDAEAECTSR